MAWADEVNEFKAAGFTDDEIGMEGAKQRAEMEQAGFSKPEIDKHFGSVEPDMSGIKAHIQENLSKATPKPAPEAAPGGAPSEPPHPAQGVLEALEAGLQVSTAGLFLRGKLPDTVLPEDAPMAQRIASQVGTFAGDLPAMELGKVFGGMAGSVAGPLGQAVGQAAGAFALPSGLRTLLMDRYAKGDVKDFQDFWERTSAVLLDTVKGGLTGAATFGAGKFVGGAMAKTAAPVLARTAAQTSAELATMVTVGKALDGHAPKPEDFIEGAILLGGIHAFTSALPALPRGATETAAKLREIYAKTGVKPTEVLEDARQNPTIHQDLLSTNVEIPTAYQGMIEGPKAEAPALSEQPLPPSDAKAPEPAPRSEAEQKILSQIGTQKEAEGKSYSFDEFYKDFVDKTDPVKKGLETILKSGTPEPTADKNPHILTRMANDYPAKTKHFIEKGVLDFDSLAVTGKAFQEIVEPFAKAKDLEGLQAYWLSKRALEVEGRGIKSGFDVEAAQDVVRSGKGKYDQAVNDLVEFANGGLKYARDAGILSSESFQAMKEAGAAYAPLKRILEEGEGGGKQGKPSNLKRLTGSDRQVQNPLVSLLENTESLIRVAEKNRAVKSFVELAAQSPKGSELLERVPSQLRPTEVSSAEVTRALEDQGIIVTRESFKRSMKESGLKLTDEQIDKALENEQDVYRGYIEAFKVFRPQSKTTLANNEFEVFRNGKREVYKAREDLAEAFKTLDGDPAAVNVLFRIMRGFTAVKKIGVTFTPDFVMRNVFRDQLTAGTFSKGGAIPFTDMLVAMGDLIKKNDDYYRWLKAGGANGSFMDLGEKYLNKEIFKLDEETGFRDAVWNLAKKPVDFLRISAELTEQATRLAEFKRVTKGEASGSKVFEGGFASREVTVDFQRMGAKLSAMNAITAFMNVQVQGLDRTIRAVGENPTGVLAKAATYLTVPSILLWWANKDDPRWKEIPRWEKDLFWIVMTKDHVYRLPKPQELGVVFGSLPERAMEKFFTDNPKAMKDFDETMFHLITPSFVPDAISPVIEQHFNKSLFTGNTIVPRRLEGILPQYQYNEYTSESAKQIGKLIAAMPGARQASIASPAVIDNYVQGWGGNLGKYAVQLADQALIKSGVVPDPVKPESTLADIPFIKAFMVRYPSTSAQSIQDFYERYRVNEMFRNTVHFEGKQGNVAEMEKLLQDPEVKEHMLKLQGVHDALSNQHKIIQLIYQNPKMKPFEKRQMIDGIYYQMIKEAEQGNKMLDQAEKMSRTH